MSNKLKEIDTKNCTYYIFSMAWSTPKALIQIKPG